MRASVFTELLNVVVVIVRYSSVMINSMPKLKG